MGLSIEDRIEELRTRMIDEAKVHGCLCHERVVAISQQLDECLVYYQKMMQRKQRLKLSFTYRSRCRYKTAIKKYDLRSRL